MACLLQLCCFKARSMGTRLLRVKQYTRNVPIVWSEVREELPFISGITVLLVPRHRLHIIRDELPQFLASQ